MAFKLKNLRMIQQALVIQGTIIMLALILICLLLLPLFSNGIKIIEQSSHEALVKSNDAKVSLLSNKIQTLIDQAFLSADLTLNKAQALYLKNINSQYKMTSSQKKKLDNGYLLTYQQPLNSEIINSTSEYFHKFGNLVQQINQFLLSFNLEYSSNIQFLLRIQKPHITSVFSPITILQTIDIEQRPYYTEHIQQNNTRLIGKPFISASTQKVSFMISQTIYDQVKNKDIIMILGFQFDNLSKYLSLNNIKFVLCSLSGIIVSSNINNAQVQSFKELTYIYNQTIFPFTNDDWIQMNKYLQNQTYQSNCYQSFIKFCRNMDGNDIQLDAQYIQNKFISIIFNDLSFTKQEDQILKSNINELTITIINYGILFCSFCLIILLISTIYITKIIKPAAEMIKVVDLQVQNQSLYEIDIQEQDPQDKNIFKELQKSFVQLIKRHINYRSQKIQRFNQQHYPPYSYNTVLNTKGIKQIVGKPKILQQRSRIELKSQYCSEPHTNIMVKIFQIIQER